MASKTFSGTASLRYATALLDTAAEQNALDVIEKDLNELLSMMAGSEDLRQAMESPLYSREDQKKAMAAIADQAKFNSISKNFLLLLAENRRLFFAEKIIESVKEELSRRRGEMIAEVQSAFELSGSQTQELQRALSSQLGQDVTLKVDVKPDLLGGLVVTIGSKMIDDSVKRKLERLKRAMQSQSNQNLNQQQEVI